MKELNEIQVNLVAPKGQYNSFGKYKYRSAEDILNAVKPLLKKTSTSLIVEDDIVMVGDRIYVKALATLCNAKGEKVSTSAFAREEMTKKGMDSSQITGSASSYARKYALNGLFAIDDTKDADATNTHQKESPKKETKKTESQLLNEKIKSAGVDLKEFAKFAQLSKDNPMNTTLCLKNFDSMIEQFNNEGS